MPRQLHRLSWLVLVGWLAAVPASAQVAFDNAATNHGISVTSVATTAFTISGTNRAGICGLYRIGAITSIAVTLSGTSGSLVAGTNVTNSVTTDLWKVIAPPAGASKTGNASWTTAMSAALGCVTATNVDQTTAVNNGNTGSTGFGTTVSVTVTSNSGDLTVSQVGTGGSTTGNTSNQTRKTDDWGGMDIGAGSGNTTHTWTVGVNDNLEVSGANFIQASGGGGCTAPPNQLLMAGVGNCHGEAAR